MQPVGEPLGLGLVGDPARVVPEDLTEDPRVRVVDAAAPGGVDLGKPAVAQRAEEGGLVRGGAAQQHAVDARRPLPTSPSSLTSRPSMAF
ncbi:hypothetical protein HEP87_39175 [Streptomyces sp. S1D4-11]|nr:hypothetical protein [Streptomyces sp. S1D4-11]QIY98889.1 hypothetical protein HEP87_39175 [Streptomyces sp. S1D4-11]